MEDPSDAKVAKFDHAALREENVLGLDVTVQDFAIMAVLECEADLGEPVQDLVLAEVVFGGLGLPLVARLVILDLQRHVTTYDLQARFQSDEDSM